VLPDQQMNGRSYFYFRDPAYLNRLPAGLYLLSVAGETLRAHTEQFKDRQLTERNLPSES
jgi:hypothetical protein